MIRTLVIKSTLISVNLHKLMKNPAKPTESDESVELPESINNSSTHSADTGRPPPSTNNNPIYVREKFRLCEEESAQKFLKAMKFRSDEVLVRCADLDTPEKIFAADIYCHKHCLCRYIHLARDTE